MDTKAGKWGADFLLLVNTFFWGITFVIVKDAISTVGVFVFLAQRFFFAFIILLLICLFARRPVTRATFRQGCVMGLFLYGAFALQTLGLLYTTASNAAFLTGLNIVLVPVIGGIFFGHRVTAAMKTGVVAATVGLFLLSTNGTMSLNRGDILVTFCAVCVALHVIYTGEFARRSDVYWLTAIQIGTVAFLSGCAGVVTGDDIFQWHPEILGALIICVLFATVFCFFVQTSMQRFTSPTHTALIFCMEPVFGAIYAYWAAGERFGPWGLFGALLIFTGMILSEVSLPPRFILPRDSAAQSREPAWGNGNGNGDEGTQKAR